MKLRCKLWHPAPIGAHGDVSKAAVGKGLAAAAFAARKGVLELR